MRFDILLLLSLLAVIIGLIACSPPPNPTPTLSPTLFPNITLKVYNPQLINTLTPNSLPSATIIAPIPTLADINISPPQCYAINTQQVTCLGYVNNQSNTPVGDITLKASTISTNDEITHEHIFTLEQQVIMVGMLAPYRIQIPNTQLEAHHFEVEVISASRSVSTSLSLDILNMEGMYQLEENRYIFTAELDNMTDELATGIRLIITLEDNNNRIIGYRVEEIQHDLASGEQMPVRVLITPLEATPNIRHRITLEAFAQN